MTKVHNIELDQIKARFPRVNSLTTLFSPIPDWS